MCIFWPTLENHAALLPPYSFSPRRVTDLFFLLQDSRRRDIENSQDHLVNELVRWKVLSQLFLESAVCYSQSSSPNSLYSSYMENTLAFPPTKPLWQKLEASVVSEICYNCGWSFFRYSSSNIDLKTCELKYQVTSCPSDI